MSVASTVVPLRPRWRDGAITTRTSIAVALTAPLALASVPLAVILSALIVFASVVDAFLARRPPSIDRAVATSLSRGVPVPLRVRADPTAKGVRLRQPLIADLAGFVVPHNGVPRPPSRRGIEDRASLDAILLPLRRGRHELPAVAVSVDGPLGLGRWLHRGDDVRTLRVYPDLHTARRIAEAVRTSRYQSEGKRRRGPLGLGTEFEAVREYRPDDDVRQINWKATMRTGRAHSNTFRVEHDRDVMCCVDVGRLMAGPLSGPRFDVAVEPLYLDGDLADAASEPVRAHRVAGPDALTRLDAALDGVVAIARVSDVLGDRCGLVAYDDTIRRNVRPSRLGATRVEEATLDLEPSDVDSDHGRGLREVGGGKRAIVFVFTDLLEPAAVGPLLDALPALVRRHTVVVVSATDADLDEVAHSSDVALRANADAWRRVVAADLMASRAAAVRAVQTRGARVVEAPAELLATRCVDAYLSATPRTAG